VVHKTRNFPRNLYIRIQPDSAGDILIAGNSVAECLGQTDISPVGIYRLVRVVDVRREINVHELDAAGNG